MPHSTLPARPAAWRLALPPLALTPWALLSSVAEEIKAGKLKQRQLHGGMERGKAAEGQRGAAAVARKEE